MRVLSELELDYVSGGEDITTVTVVGHKIKDSDIDSEDYLSKQRDDIRPGKGDGKPGTSPAERRALKIQAAALALKAQILADPDHKKHEDLGYIYIDANGDVAYSQLIIDSDGIDGKNKGLVVPLAQSIGYQNIIGIVHNHDSLHYSDMAYENRMPSQNDHDTGVRLDSLNGALPFTNYIIDTVDAMRAYTTSNDKSPTAVIK